VQLRKLPAITARRRAIAAAYDKRVSEFYARPRTLPGHLHVYHQYTLRVPLEGRWSRDQVREELEREGIATGVYYPLPVHLQPPYRALRDTVSCPVAERAAVDMLSIPVHPGVTDADCQTVAEQLNRLATGVASAAL
jgi:dTDP-4-amino-4,6-dideoxygalactose transaminase